jgi:hypothetical protein
LQLCEDRLVRGSQAQRHHGLLARIRILVLQRLPQQIVASVIGSRAHTANYCQCQQQACAHPSRLHPSSIFLGFMGGWRGGMLGPWI